MQDYQVERRKFLEAQLVFKAGEKPEAGALAISILLSMFYILPASRYFASEPEKAQAFVDECDGLRGEIFRYKNTKSPPQSGNYYSYPEFLELDNKYDALVRKFYHILMLTGFSP